MGEVVPFAPPVIAVVAQPDGSMIEIRAGDRISVDDRGWTRVHRLDAAPRRARSWIGLFRRDT